MRRNHPIAEFRKADPRQAAIGFSIQFGAGMALRALNIFTDIRSFARVFHYRHLTTCLQIVVIALLVTVGPWATARISYRSGWKRPDIIYRCRKL